MEQPPSVQMRSQLLSDGLSNAEILRMRRSGVLADVRRGSYVAPDDPRLRRPEARHRLLIESTLPRLKPGAVLSHVSAAVWLGLPIWRIPMKHVHVTRDGRSGRRVSGRQHLHVAPLDAEEVMEVGGVMVTSWSRGPAGRRCDHVRPAPTARRARCVRGARAATRARRRNVRPAGGSWVDAGPGLAERDRCPAGHHPGPLPAETPAAGER